MGLEADLSDFSVSQILFLMSAYKKTGRLSVSSIEKRGEIYLKDGAAVHASCGDIHGAEAIYNLCLLLTGKAKFETGVETTERSVSESAEKLIKEGDRRRVELTEVLGQLPPFETILVRTPKPPDESTITIRRSDWSVLALVNGKRNIKAIVDDSKMGMLDVLKTLSWLISKGLVLDPTIVDRALSKEVHLLNILLEEYGGKADSLKPWISFIEESIITLEAGVKIRKYLKMDSQGIQMLPGMKGDISADEVKVFFEGLTVKLNERASAEFGPILAKRKYQNVLKQSS